MYILQNIIFKIHLILFHAHLTVLAMNFISDSIYSSNYIFNCILYFDIIFQVEKLQKLIKIKLLTSFK